MKKVISYVAISYIAIVAILAGCGGNNSAASLDEQKTADNKPTAQTTAEKKLVMATSADYPPYEFHDNSGGKDQIVGFDVDIANYIAKDLGLEFEIKDMDFNKLLPALQSKHADFVIAGMTPKPERLQNVDFSDIYYEAKNTIVTKKSSSLTKPEDLVGKKVGVQRGSILEGEAKDMKGVQVVPLNEIPEIIQEIKSNQIDAAIIEETVAKGYVQTGQDIESHTISNSGPSGSAVAFPKGAAHVAEFNKSIKKLRDSGELDKLIKKWFKKK